MRCTCWKYLWFRKSRGRLLTIYHGWCLWKKFSFPFTDISKLWKWSIGAAVVRQKLDFCYYKNRPPTSGVTYPLCIKPFMGLDSQVAHVKSNNAQISGSDIFLQYIPRFKSSSSSTHTSNQEYKSQNQMLLNSLNYHIPLFKCPVQVLIDNEEICQCES